MPKELLYFPMTTVRKMESKGKKKDRVFCQWKEVASFTTNWLKCVNTKWKKMTEEKHQ